MQPTGPLYCETGHGLLFMAEPVNTITNAFIIVAAVFALREVRRAKVGMPFDLAILLFLLFATGIGSFFWHAFRTRVALAFDAIPGLLFLFVMAGLWFRALWGNFAGILGALLLLALAAGAPYLWWHGVTDVPRALIFVPAFVAISAVGAGLSLMTVQRYGAATARLGALAILSSMIAALCRSVDLLVCNTIPIGLHWVWHITLSLAAYLGIVMLTRMKTTPAMAASQSAA